MKPPPALYANGPWHPQMGGLPQCLARCHHLPPTAPASPITSCQPNSSLPTLPTTSPQKPPYFGACLPGNLSMAEGSGVTAPTTELDTILRSPAPAWACWFLKPRWSGLSKQFCLHAMPVQQWPRATMTGNWNLPGNALVYPTLLINALLTRLAASMGIKHTSPRYATAPKSNRNVVILWSHAPAVPSVNQPAARQAST